ncbi:MAG: hypothetical protein WBA17_08400, partial [Saprospiraceae bacterium]
MISFFGQSTGTIYALQHPHPLAEDAVPKLSWLFGNRPQVEQEHIAGVFVGPRAAMVTPWSTNAVEITRNMAVDGIERIEEFRAQAEDFRDFDPMLAQRYVGLDQDIFTVRVRPEPIREIADIAAYNEAEGLALSDQEVTYLLELAVRLGRLLTDSEVFGFSQVNSEHCRHKIFNGTFIINDEVQPHSLFQLIKQTAAANPGGIVSAYKD